MREIILDTETTGLNPLDGHRIIEIGCLEMIDKVLTGQEFHYYINPQRNVPQDAYNIHGISSEFLVDKPLFSNIVDDFLSFINGATLVIHNAKFDIGFINHELSLLGKMPIDLDVVIDTLAMARRTFPGARVNLDALCKRFKIDNTMRTKHGALLDSYLLAEIYIELTGGRQRSFLLQATDGEKLLAQKEITNYNQGNNIIILPSVEELRLHEEFMSKLKG
ncbi:MAG: DNA polymerase III subunit epsilon [Rickettsiaceae bacterium]|nr:DNA polymerase III subunit epsilon [Rickettsiaceae bacterium]